MMLEVRTEYKNINDLFDLYIELGWNRINLSKEELNIMTKNSWYNLFYYDDKRLIGTGRIISDGIITGIICGVGVSPKYQKQGIGKNIVKELVSFCERPLTARPASRVQVGDRVAAGATLL